MRCCAWRCGVLYSVLLVIIILLVFWVAVFPWFVMACNGGGLGLYCLYYVMYIIGLCLVNIYFLKFLRRLFIFRKLC